MSAFLPDPRMRLTPGRKEAILSALRRRKVSRAFVLSAYQLSEEELAFWEGGFQARGRDGLSVTKIQGAAR